MNPYIRIDSTCEMWHELPRNSSLTNREAYQCREPFKKVCLHQELSSHNVTHYQIRERLVKSKESMSWELNQYFAEKATLDEDQITQCLTVIERSAGKSLMTFSEGELHGVA